MKKLLAMLRRAWIEFKCDHRNSLMEYDHGDGYKISSCMVCGRSHVLYGKSEWSENDEVKP